MPDIVVNPPRRRNVISLTPLIDVVFILLIFFMLASSFLDWQAIPMNTATAPPGNAVSTKLANTVSVDGTSLSLNGERMTMNAILLALQAAREEDPELAVRIQPVGNTSLQSVIVVLDQLKGSGHEKLNFIRDPEWQGESAK